MLHEDADSGGEEGILLQWPPRHEVAPPGFSSRRMSRKACPTFRKFGTPKRHVTTSKLCAGNGNASASAGVQVRFVSPRCLAYSSMIMSISGTRSVAVIWPWEPTASARRPVRPSTGQIEHLHANGDVRCLYDGLRCSPAHHHGVVPPRTTPVAQTNLGTHLLFDALHLSNIRLTHGFPPLCRDRNSECMSSCDAERSGSAAGRAADRPLQPVVSWRSHRGVAPGR